MLIDFVTAEDKRIKWETNSIITQHDIASVADMYALEHPNKLPTHVWMRADVYKEFSLINKGSLMAYENGQPCLLVSTGCYLLFVKPLPYSFNKFSMMVGIQKDFDRYFLDEVFEETVLANCERE